MSVLVLVSAVLGALAGGVLLAYGICQAMFRIFRMHAESLTVTRQNSPQIAPQVVQS